MNLRDLTDEELLALAQRLKITRAEIDAYPAQDQPAPEQDQPAPEQDKSFMQNIASAANKGIAGTLSFPAELGLLPFKAYYGWQGEDPTFPGTDVRLSEINPTGIANQAMNALGFDTNPQPSSMAERFATNTAESLVGGATGLGIARQTTGMAGKALQNAFGRYAAEDAAASTVGAGAKTLAEEAFGPNSNQAAGAELVANFGTAFFANKINTARDIYEAASKQGKKLKEAEKDSAATFIQGVVSESGEDPKAVADVLASQSPERLDVLTPAAASRSGALQSLEKMVVKNDPASLALFEAQSKDFKTFLDDQIRMALGSDQAVGEDFLDWYRQSSDYATNLVENHRQSLLKQAADEYSTLPPMGEDYASVVRRKLEEGHKIDRDIEKDMWATVTENMGEMVVNTNPAREALSKVKEEIRLIDEQDMQNFPPAKYEAVINVLPDIGDQSTLGELQALSSTLLQEANDARVAGNNILERRLRMLQSGIMETIDGIQAENIDALKQAKQFSRDLNDRYSRDVIGPLFSTTKRRDDAVKSNETLEYLWQAGEKGRTNISAVNLAFGETPKEVKQFVLQQFNKVAFDPSTGEMRLGAAERFARDYRPALEESGLLDTVAAYVSTGRKVKEADNSLAQVVSEQNATSAAQALQRGSTADSLSAYIQTTVKQQAKNAEFAFKDLFDSAATDLSGNATEGLKNAVANAVVGLFTDSSINQFVSVNGIKFMPKLRAGLLASGAYSSSEVDRLMELGEMAHDALSAQSKKVYKGQSNTAEDLAKTNIAGTLFKFIALTKVAPRLTSKNNPGSLATSAMLGKIGERLGRKLTENDAQSLIALAVRDPEVMQDLLKRDVGEMSTRTFGLLRAIGRGVGRFAVGGLTPSQTTIRLNEGQPEEAPQPDVIAN